MSLSAACNSVCCESFISDLHSTITVWTRSSLLSRCKVTGNIVLVLGALQISVCVMCD